MDAQQLVPFIVTLLIVGVAIGVGVAILVGVGNAVKANYTVNETVTVTSKNAVTANDEIVEILGCTNGTNQYNTWTTTASNFSYTASNGTLYTNLSNGDYNLMYTYKKDSAATTALSGTTTSISSIASTWLAIIIIVAVAAIVLGLVMNSFGKNPR